MWKNQEKQGKLRKPGDKLILPPLSESKNLSLNRPQPQRNQLLKADGLFFTLHGNNISQIPLPIHNTMGRLRSRHLEVSHWQAQINDSIGQIEREITCVKQAKNMVERCLQERQLYSQLMADCVALSSRLCSVGLRQDQVFITLRKEEQMTNESSEVLQKQILILDNKLSSLNRIMSQLLLDFQDKAEAINLATRCITFEMETPCFHLTAPPSKPVCVTYEMWLFHCQNLKLAAENIMKESSSCRRNLHFLLANLQNSYERHHCSSRQSLQKKIHELTRLNAALNMDRQTIKNEISDLIKEEQRVTYCIQNCESRFHQTTHLLDILNQRPRIELCLDHPYNSLTLERKDLEKMAAGLQSLLQHSQQNLASAKRDLNFVEDKLASNAQTLEVAKRCQSLHQSMWLAMDTAMVLRNKPKLYRALDSPRSHTDLH